MYNKEYTDVDMFVIHGDTDYMSPFLIKVPLLSAAMQ